MSILRRLARKMMIRKPSRRSAFMNHFWDFSSSSSSVSVFAVHCLKSRRICTDNFAAMYIFCVFTLPLVSPSPSLGIAMCVSLLGIGLLQRRGGHCGWQRARVAAPQRGAALRLARLLLGLLDAVPRVFDERCRRRTHVEQQALALQPPLGKGEEGDARADERPVC